MYLKQKGERKGPHRVKVLQHLLNSDQVLMRCHSEPAAQVNGINNKSRKDEIGGCRIASYFLFLPARSPFTANPNLYSPATLFFCNLK